MRIRLSVCRGSGPRLVWLASTTLLLAAAAGQMVGMARNRGGLICERPSFAFGELESRNRVVHAFLIQNRTVRTLKIDAVPGCSACLKAEVDRTLLRPGGVAKVRCELDLDQLKGLVQKTVLVRGVEESDRLLLTFTGKVIPSIGALPPAVTATRSSIRSGMVVEVCLKSHRPEELFRITSARCETAAWTVDPVTDETANQHIIRLRCTRPTSCHSYVEVRTNASWAPRIIIPIRVS